MQKFHEIFLSRLNTLRGNSSVVGFARDCGIPQQTMANYCNGERIPSMEAMTRICSANAVSADWLLGFTDDRYGTSAPATDSKLLAKISELETLIKEKDAEIRGLRYALEALGKGK